MQPADFVNPTGELRAEWFPGEDMAANLALWLAQGETAVPVGATEVQADAVARAYTYWRAYGSVVLRMAASPDAVSLGGEISRTQVKGRDFFASKAKEWRAAFEDASGASATGGSTEVAAPLASRSVPVALVL